MVLFGGRGPGATIYSDTWEFDGENWTQQEDTGPPARFGHAMNYDGAGRAVLFGGEGSGQQTFGETWAWDGQEWVQLAEFGPPARRFAAMASIFARNLVLYGGQSSSQAGAPNLADTWQFDGKRWTERQHIGPGPLTSAAKWVCVPLRRAPAPSVVVVISGARGAREILPRRRERRGGASVVRRDAALPPAPPTPQERNGLALNRLRSGIGSGTRPCEKGGNTAFPFVL